MDRRWPIPTTRDALLIGAMWAVLTVLFGFGLGHWILGSPWSQLLANYDLAAGRIWVLVPLWMAAGPLAVHRVRATRGLPPGRMRAARSRWSAP